MRAARLHARGTILGTVSPEHAAPAPRLRHRADMEGEPVAGPALLLIGSGIGDQLQLTVQASRALARVGRAYALGLGPNLAAYLRSIGVEAIDLVPRIPEDADATTAYLTIADAILQEVADDPPVAVIAPGNPFLSNSVARFLVMQAKERGISVQALPSVSPIELLITTTGLDVGTFGLQVFDARRLVAGRHLPNPAVPLAVLQVAALGGVKGIRPAPPTEPELGRLRDVLGKIYPAEHQVVHLVVNGATPAQSVSRVILSGLAGLAPGIRADSILFLDLVRRVAMGQAVQRGREG